MLPHEFPHPVRVLSADPPWLFGDKLPGATRGAEKNYQCLTLEQIKAFPLPRFADDAILFLWRVSSMQQEALDVIKAWGFVLKTELVWVKKTKKDLTAIGMGRYVRGAHETCLIATRGSFSKHIIDKGIRSVLECPLELEAPTGAHSEKPDAFYQLVEQLVGGVEHGPLVEIFGRKPRENWHVFGNEIPNGYTGSEPDVFIDTTAGAITITVPRAALDSLDAWNAAYALVARDRELAEEDSDYDALVRQLVEDFSTDEIDSAKDRLDLVTTAKPKSETKSRKNGVHVANGETKSIAEDLPAHVMPELGEHPALISVTRQLEFVERAMLEGFFKSDAAEPLQEAWIRLLYVVPEGWLKKPFPVKSSAHNPIENLSDIVAGLRRVNIETDLIAVSGWSVNDRGRVFDWLERGADMTAVPAIVGEIFAKQMVKETGNPNIEIRNSGCAACDKGTPWTSDTAYLHTGEGPVCKTPATIETHNNKPKKGRGPAKKKTEAADDWSEFVTRAKVAMDLIVDGDQETYGPIAP